MVERELDHTGFHSSIKLGESGGQKYLRKQYGEKAGGFEPDQAQVLANHMQSFISLANEIGIPTTRPLGQSIEPNGHPGRVTLVEMVPYVGIDLRQQFGDTSVSDDEVIDDIEGYLELHKRAWQSGFRISLDPPPANFCKDDQGQIWYIDTMPPRQKLQNQDIVSEWPTPPEENRKFIENRYFSPQQAQVIYPQLMRALIGRDIPPKVVKEVMEFHLGDEIKPFIDFSEDNKKQILANPNPFVADALRIIAIEELYKYPDPQKMKDIFHLTHIQTGGIVPPQEDVVEASMIIQSIGKDPIVVFSAD